MKYFWRAVLFFMLLLPLGLLFALFTEWGSRSLLNTIDGLTPLEIEYGGGSVSSQLRINRLLFTTDGLVLELHDLVAELVPGCLWRSALCFSQLQASSLDLAILPGEDSETPQPDTPDKSDSAELIEFPVILETDVLALSSARIHWQGGEWRQGAAQIQLRIKGSTIEIINAEIDAAYLELIEQGEADDPASNTISLPRIDLPLALEVEQLLLRQPSWNVYGAQHSHQSIELQGGWRNAQLRLEHLGIAEQETGELALQGELTFDAQWPLDITADIKLGEPPSWPQLHGRAIMLSVTGSLADLTLALSSAGVPALAVEAQINALDRQVPFTTTAKLTSSEHLPLADIVEVPAQFADAGIEFPLVVTATGSLAQQQFDLQGTASGLGYPAMSLLLGGRHQEGHITLQQLQLQDAAGTNNLQATGEVTVAPQLQFALTLLSTGIELPRLGDEVEGRIQGGLQVSGSVQDESWQVAIADVDLAGSINALPASITGYAGTSADALLTDSKLNAQLNGAQLALYVEPGSGQPAQIELTVADLERWQTGSRGLIQLQATLSADRQQLEASASLRDVLWQGVQVRQGTASGNYRHGENPLFKLNALFDDVELAGNKLDSLQLLLDGSAAQHKIAVEAQGDVQGRLSVSGALSGATSGVVPGEQWRGKLAPATIETPQGSWQLGEAVSMDWSQATGQLRLSGHCWRQQQTRLCPGELDLGRQTKGSVEVAGDMGFISRLLPDGLDLQGDMQLRLQGSWDPDNGALLSGRSQTSAMLLTQEFGEGESASVGWDKGAAVFDYDKNGLKLEWEIFRGGRRIADLNLLLPPDRGQALVGAVNFEQLQLATMAPLAPKLSRLEGELSGRLQLSGTTDVPLAHGLLSLSGGHMAMVGNPTELARLDLNLELQGDRAQLRGSGVLGGGQLLLDGELRTKPELQLVLQLKGEQHNILYPPSAELVISENLRVEVLKELIQVTGELIVEEGELKFEQLPEGSVALSDDVVQVDYMGNVVREEFPLDIGMDVWVRIRDRFKVMGSLLETTLGGDLHLQQKPGQPLQLFGNLTTLGGEVRAYQQRLSLDWGVISFSGPPANPLLDIRAQRKFTSSGVTAGVQVQGQLQGDLELEVFTDPVMSQNEAMSYLVRGRGMDSGAAADGTAVALSVAGGVVSRSTLVSELNRIPGVSNIEFGATGSDEDTAATVGGYIGSRLYLSYGFGLYEPINVLTARLYLGTRWWLEVVSRLENSVDMYYSFDIQ